MKTYIALLRGINVSGKNSLKMAVLKQLATDLNLVNVQTYIQSGNLIFQSEELDPTLLSQQIHQAIFMELGLTIPILTFTVDSFKTILNQNPFSQTEEQEQLYLTFFEAIPHSPNLEAIQAKKATEELLHYSDSVLYLVAALGYGKTKLSNTFLEKKLHVSATTRNYKTCLKLLELAEID